MKAGVAPATMRLIERFAAFRKRTTLEVLRAYKGQDQAVRASMRADMQRMLDEHTAKEQEEIAARGRLGAPGLARLALIEKSNEVHRLRLESGEDYGEVTVDVQKTERELRGELADDILDLVP